MIPSLASRQGLLVAVWTATACVTLAGTAAAGQTPPPLHLDAAVDLALAHYPAVQAAQAGAASAQGGVSLAKTAYLPRTDLIWQQNRATRNNVAGLLFPQAVIPSITGPVADATSQAGLWGSAAGVLLSWEAFDFGLRRANTVVAARLVKQATAGIELTRLQVAVAAADAFLGALAADEAVRAAQANVDRLQVFDTVVAALVRADLKPGADRSRADVELAAARIQLFHAQQTSAFARAALAEAIGAAGETVVPDPGSLLRSIPPPAPHASAVETHPLAQAQQSAVETVVGREDALNRAYAPRVNLQGAWFARGAVAPGAAGSGTDGLFPDTPNWALGLTFTFPVFDLFNVRARRQIEAGNEAVERARYDQLLDTLKTEAVRARTQIESARLVAETTPAELTAAQAAEAQARARYQAGLASITEIAEAQRLLAQSEIDDRLARLGVWRALLVEANARGDLGSFLDQVRSFGRNP